MNCVLGEFRTREWEVIYPDGLGPFCSSYDIQFEKYQMLWALHIVSTHDWMQGIVSVIVCFCVASSRATQKAWNSCWNAKQADIADIIWENWASSYTCR